MSDKSVDTSIQEKKHSVKESKLLEKAHTLPKNPGCYLMHNSKKEIIYVGKAKDLKNRVSSYFNQSAKTVKTLFLVSHIEDFEFIVTETEAESFILENNLIKKYKPKYNIRLKDDKTYPYLMVNYNEDFPRLEYVRRPKLEKNREFYGPFPTGSNISEILKILTKCFRLRDCSLHEFNSRKTPCLLYQMGQCSAPCVGYISKEDYAKDLKIALDFFSGERKSKATLKIISNRMLEYANNEEFEKAALIRDMLTTLESFLSTSYKQNVEFTKEKDIDIVSYFVGEEEVDLSVYMVRNGALIGHKNFHFSLSLVENEIEDEIISYLVQYYSNSVDLKPSYIVTDMSPSKKELFQDILTNLEDEKKMKILYKSKKYESLLSSTKKHAEETQRVRILNEDSKISGLNRLKEILKLKDTPRVLECYDIAIWQGKSPTASQIVFHDGEPDKKNYRHYHLEEREEGNNDFAMMREVFLRRLKHGNLPDVFIVDGGTPQVNTVLKVLEEEGINIPIIGIAKSRDLVKGYLSSRENSKSDERLIIPGRSNPVILKKIPSLFKIIVQMRDEAHRFSRRLHHNKEEARVIGSWLDEVPFIGEKTKEIILKNLNVSKDELKNFDVQKIQKYFGIQLKQARSLYDFLHSDN